MASHSHCARLLSFWNKSVISVIVCIDYRRQNSGDSCGGVVLTVQLCVSTTLGQFCFRWYIGKFYILTSVHISSYSRQRSDEFSLRAMGDQNTVFGSVRGVMGFLSHTFGFRDFKIKFALQSQPTQW